MGIVDVDQFRHKSQTLRFVVSNMKYPFVEFMGKWRKHKSDHCTRARGETGSVIDWRGHYRYKWHNHCSDQLGKVSALRPIEATAPTTLLFRRRYKQTEGQNRQHLLCQGLIIGHWRKAIHPPTHETQNNDATDGDNHTPPKKRQTRPERNTTTYI